MKNNLYIQIVRTSIPGLNTLSQSAAESIQAILRKYYRRVDISIVGNVKDLESLAALRPDLVFVGFKYLVTGTTKVWLTSYLKRHGIAHTGSPRQAIEFEQDKSLAKQRVLAAGLNTPAYLVVPNCQPLDALKLELPVFVKPMNLGGSRGIDEFSVAHSLTAVNDKLAELAAGYATDALVEEYLPGREFGVAILKREHAAGHWVMPVELKPPANTKGDRLLSHARKASPLPTPALLVKDPVLQTAIRKLALEVFMALGACDYGRIDIRLDSTGRPSFIEANLMPGLVCDSGYFFRACKMHLGMNQEQMILAIVQLALNRVQSPAAQSGYPKSRDFGKITQYLPS